ncbi:hypothetical protein TWF569_007975 [Orbilia oligospora]|uniref:Uncharacterized protein n=1 Tax=Orbilia oligospora TaxID=2813651 RepID=A0A7C8NZM5_ORBOL|nr:hypothetical protein TWF102_000325 [Orbilia oligospora]KAF3113779.1 hypothetical protein TWF706_009152 [Orbilia oligospora]KAF3115977.1 hypothetical protein TWF103_010203 [Orbilia oligospora]KAF3138202.1 hypothetical protein TWF703_004731 [Orbilia oligospora]KAF3149673.1 hypothetical protein TWF594_010772 [Orbilia oligospora]
MEFSDRDTLCPSPNFTVKTQSSTSSTFSLNGFKNRLSNIFHSSSAPTSPTEDKKFRMSILSSRSTKTTTSTTRRLRKQAVRNKSNPSSPRSNKSGTSLLSKISFKRHITIRTTRVRRFSTFHHKPSTLDFRCAGDETSSIMILERVNSVNMNRMIFGAVQKRRRGDLTYLLTDCPPTIAWISPDIASGWDFSEIGITIN